MHWDRQLVVLLPLWPKSQAQDVPPELACRDMGFWPILDTCNSPAIADNAKELGIDTHPGGLWEGKGICRLRPQSKQTDFDVMWAKGVLREAGLRGTAARVAVMQCLAAKGSPLSHAEVADSLTAFGFDQSTIFRALQELSEADIVSRLDLGDQIRRFELRNQAGSDQLEHPHFMCVDCGKLSCLDDFTFSLAPSRGPRREQLGEITEVLLKGHCGACSRS